MRPRWLLLALAVLLAGGLAQAGRYHQGATLICSDCHVMHASLQHDYAGQTTADNFGAFPQSYGVGGVGANFLLKSGDGTVSDMCLACHDGATSAPDVLGTDTNATLTGRSGGGLTAFGMHTAAGYDEWKGHTLESTDDPPGYDNNTGYDPTAGLECTNCHHQHGSTGSGALDIAGAAISATDGAYRNLRSFTIDGQLRNVSYAFNANVLTKDVYLNAGGDMPYAVENTYETDSINLNEPVITNSGMATWCAACHGDFHGALVSGTEYGGEASGANWIDFNRHPSTTVNIGAVGGGHSALTGSMSDPERGFANRNYRVRVMSPTGVWGPIGSNWASPPTDLTPTCLSCHKGHGNQRAFGLIYAKGVTALGEEGDGLEARDLCRQCHIQGGSFTGQ